jgi:hypothetical protein
VAALELMLDLWKPVWSVFLQDAATATDVMRKVDPDAAPVRPPVGEWKTFDAAQIVGPGKYGSPMARAELRGVKPSRNVKRQARELAGEPERNR